VSPKTDTQLGAIFVAAMRIWDAQKVDGVPLTERILGLGQTLRAAWPQTREWKYVCDACADYGLVMATCPGDRTCGRERPHLAHDCGRPCWCEAGRVFRAKPTRPTAEDAIASAARVPKKVGRW
jgi:hypothetical protein